MQRRYDLKYTSLIPQKNTLCCDCPTKPLCNRPQWLGCTLNKDSAQWKRDDSKWAWHCLAAVWSCHWMFVCSVTQCGPLMRLRKPEIEYIFVRLCIWCLVVVFWDLWYFHSFSPSSCESYVFLVFKSQTSAFRPAGAFSEAASTMSLAWPGLIACEGRPSED